MSFLRLLLQISVPPIKPFLWESWAMLIPALVILDGREQGSGRACTLLAHQSSIQALVSTE